MGVESFSLFLALSFSSLSLYALSLSRFPLSDLSLSLFIGLAVGTYSSIFIAPPFLASLREKEPAMIALRKRVEARGATPAAVATVTSARPVQTRGPRNQPKRKGRK